MALNNFDLGFKAEKVVNIVEEAGEKLVCVKFCGQSKTQLIPAHVVSEKIPILLIDYYDDHMQYESPAEEGHDINGKDKKSGKRKTKSAANPKAKPKKKPKKQCDNAGKRDRNKRN